MKGKYIGPMSIDDLFQALFQDRTFFSKHGIAHIRNATLYFTPCDETGQTTTVVDGEGLVIEGFTSAGAYSCAADHYDNPTASLEPTPQRKPPPRKTRPIRLAPF